MPPALSEDDASASETDIPFKDVDTKAKKAKPVEEEDEEDEDEEEDAETFEVEKIMSHTSDDEYKDVRYEVMWAGYPNIKDRTWEPREHLLDDETGRPIDALQNYIDKECGGKEPVYIPKKQRERAAREAEQAQKAAKAGARKRKLSQSTPNTPTTNESKSRRKTGRGRPSSATPQEDAIPTEPKKKQIDLPTGSWEKLIADINTIEEIRNDKTGEKERFAYVEWHDQGRCQSKHALKLLRVKCPNKLLDYYEKHLVFHARQSSIEQNGDDDGDIRGELDSDVFMGL